MEQNNLGSTPAPGAATTLPRPLALSIAIAATLALSACFDGNGSSGGGNTALTPAEVYVASNGGGDTDVRVRDEALNVLNTYNTGGNEGILVDSAGRLVQAQDANLPASLITACNAKTRSTGDTTRSLAGLTTGLVTPKGITRIESTGMIVVANVGANNLLVFGSAAAGDRLPLATVGLGSNAWDTSYDAVGDRLFVAQTNGAVAVFDNFSSDLGQTETPRIFTAATAGDTSNMHGIDYDQASDRLVVSDVGSAADATDGRLYVFDNASTATGAVTPSVTLFGPATQLGNPVDLELDGSIVRIAEKSNDAILVYRDIFSADDGDTAPDDVIATTKPESIAVVPEGSEVVGATDIVDPSGDFTLIVSSNPAPGSPTSARLFSVDRDLSASTEAFNVAAADLALTGIENVVLDGSNDAYVAFDAALTPGIAVLGTLSARPNGSVDWRRDRVIQSPATQLATPKGVEIADNLGLILVSDTGAGSVLVYSACATGNSAPLASLPGNGTPWDSDYAPDIDTLFVALTNGTLDIYDDFSTDLGAAGPSRSITASPAAVNLHSVRYDPGSDTLIISDVGSGAVADDGALFTIESASTADGVVNVGKRIAGAATLLGNPVDIAFDGADLFVAEKANGGGAVQVWRDFLTDTALDGNVAPSDSLSLANPESLVLMRSL